MGIHSTFQILLTLIEQRSRDKLTAQVLADAVFLSPSHLQRLFRLCTGQSLMDYVRGRKLAHSLTALLEQGMRVVDVAGEFGFGHEQSYIRAFRSEYGCTPGRARRDRVILPVRERISPHSLRPVQDGLLCGPEYVMVPPFRLAGRPHLFRQYSDEAYVLEPNQLGREFYREFSGRIPDAIQPEVYIGLSRILGGDVEYIPGIPVHSLDHIPPGLKGVDVPGGFCAHFRYVGPHPPEEVSLVTARELYGAIDAYFAGQQRYRLCGGYYFERIDPAAYDGAYCRMEWLTAVEDALD